MGGVDVYSDPWNHKWLKTVQIIDAETGDVTLGPELPYAVSYAAGIAVQHKIYLFGGVNKLNNTDHWLMLDLDSQKLIIYLSFYLVYIMNFCIFVFTQYHFMDGNKF